MALRYDLHSVTSSLHHPAIREFVTKSTIAFEKIFPHSLHRGTFLLHFAPTV
jgi:hypothetical protein